MLDQTTEIETMSAYNDITGEPIQSKALSKQGRDNWDNIFKKKTHETATQHSNSDNPRKGRATGIPASEDRITGRKR